MALALVLAACGGEPAKAPLGGDEATTTAVADGSAVAVASSASPAATTPASALTTPSAAPSAPPSATPPAALEPLPSGTTILVIGDSFAGALGAGLKTKEQETGIHFIQKGEKATFIPEWAGPNKNVAGLLVMYKPDLVIIALGGNELAMTTPDIRAPKVKKLVEIVGSTPCVWVSPPLWDIKDNGLLGVIHDNSLPCRYIDSNKLVPDLPRGGDKIHPTAAGQRIWAGAFLDWLQREREPNGPAKFSLKPRAPGE